jgi:hypothetical protein
MGFGRRDKDEDYPITGAARREAAMRFVFLTLLAVAVAAGYALSQFRGLREPAAMEAAQVARHLAEGRGFVTRCVRPFDLWYLQSRGVAQATPDAPVPVLWTAPGLPALQSVFLRLVRPRYAPRQDGGFLNDAETGVIVPLGIALTLLTTLVVWLSGRVLFGPRTALLAAGAYAVADLTLSTAISGLPTPAAALAATLALLLAVLAARRSSATEGGWGVAALTAASALCAAAAILADHALLVAAVGAAVLLGVELQRRRWLMLPLFLLVLALALLPWVMHNRAAGIGALGALPYTALRETPLFPADSLERSTAPVFNVYRAAAAVRQGFAGRVMALADGGGFARGGVMFCFFLVALFHRYEQSACRTLKAITLLMLATMALLPVVPGTGSVGAWTALYPLVVLFGMSAFTDFLDREETFDTGMKPLLTALLLVLCMLPAGLRMLRGPAAAYPPYHGPIQQFAAGIPEAGQILLTDIPWATAWYGGGTSVLLPVHPDEVAVLPGGWAAVGGLYLTSAVAGRGDSPWTLMRIGGQVPESVPFTHGVNLPVGRRDQLLLTRGER